MAAGLAARGVRLVADLNEATPAPALVIGGTRHFWGLRRIRQLGLPVVQRLDGMNWLHRRAPLRSGLRHFLRAEYGNLTLELIRTRLATHVVYQSEFVRDWWERAHGPAPVPSSVIYNGVDLARYTPDGAETSPQDRWRILMVEGSLAGGYEGGLDVGFSLAQRLARRAPFGRLVELFIAGRTLPEHRRRIEAQLVGMAPAPGLIFAGLVDPAQVPSLDRGAHVLYSADINAACPNSAIEAMACGLPVLGFATGALPELVTGDAGRLAAYNGDPWKLDPPDLEGLAAAAETLLLENTRFRPAARRRAEDVFGLDRMVDAYLDILLGRRP
jgi:glycosyltransferase involved in cell wall biosynthesis